MRQRRLADAGQILDQQVSARQQAGQGETDLAFLAEHDLAGLADHLMDGGSRHVLSKQLRSDDNNATAGTAVLVLRLLARYPPIGSAYDHDHRIHHPPRLLAPRHGVVSPGMPRAPGCDQRSADRFRSRHVPDVPRCAGGHARASWNGCTRAATSTRFVRSSPAHGIVHLDPDTAMCPGTLQAALRSAGAGVLATDLVMSGDADSAFCAVRPPGHHAERARAMGFCFFNNVAVAVAHALDGPRPGSRSRSSISTCTTVTAPRTFSSATLAY